MYFFLTFVTNIRGYSNRNTKMKRDGRFVFVIRNIFCVFGQEFLLTWTVLICISHFNFPYYTSNLYNLKFVEGESLTVWV